MRFQAVEDVNGAWKVQDNESKKWDMPEMAVSIFLTEKGAREIAQTLNHEWECS